MELDAFIVVYYRKEKLKQQKEEPLDFQSLLFTDIGGQKIVPYVEP